MAKKIWTIVVGCFCLQFLHGAEVRDSILQLNLDEVVVQGRRSTYVMRIDKRVFNVGTDLMSTTGLVSDLMRNIPSVQVDVEGNVSLRGSESVNILIDGKPSTLMNTRTRADALRQIPASEIERIEVITNPSAQYKPDGVSGIINLVILICSLARFFSGQ